MSRVRTEARQVHPRRERGMALITGLLLLLVVTIIALSMFRSFGMQEKIAGNTREKDRALNAAVSAQQFAENWLKGGTAPTVGGVCTGPVSSNVGQVCTNPPDNGFGAPPWTVGGAPVYIRFDGFTQPINSVTQTLSASSPSMGSWYQQPQFWVTFLGTVGSNVFYQVDAAGWGGTPNSVAVVESTYEISPGGLGSGGGNSPGSGTSLDK
ncbi:MAG: pilus assembly PilX family protein [Steroidobacteraceae bacterium]